LLYYSVNRTPEKSATRLITIDSPDQPIRLFPGLVVAEYAKGALLFARGRAGAYTLLAQPMTLPDGQLTGEPVEIGRTRISETLGRAVMAASPSGVIVTLGPIESVGHFTWLSRDGRVLDTVGAPAVQMGVELSPDRQQVATFRSGEIWALNLSRPVPSRLTTGVNRHPIWSPDGGQILTLDQGRGNLGFDLVTTTTTSAEVKTLRQAPGFVKPMGWTRDHRLVWIEGMPSGSSIWMMDSNGQAREVFRESAWIAEARVSPDGRWIAYSSNRSGRFEIELSRFPEFGQRYPLSVAGGGYPRWRGDGKEIFFLSADRRLMAASFVAGPSPSVGTPTSLFEVDLVAHPDRLNFAAYEYDAAGDGSRFLINRLVSPPDESLSMIVDWNPPR
jgi:hypothetical protein